MQITQRPDDDPRNPAEPAVAELLAPWREAYRGLSYREALRSRPTPRRRPVLLPALATAGLAALAVALFLTHDAAEMPRLAALSGTDRPLSLRPPSLQGRDAAGKARPARRDVGARAERPTLRVRIRTPARPARGSG